MSVSRNPLARAREAAGFSQETFADAVGVSRNTVSRWERGVFLPAAGLRLKVADALGITPGELHDLLDRARRWSHAKTGTGQPAVDEDQQQLVELSRHTAEETVDAVRSSLPELRRVLARIDLPDDGLTRPLPQLQTDVETVIKYRLDSRYVQLAWRLPDLIAELARAAESTNRRRAAALMTLALRAADGMVYKHGYHDLSARIIDLMRSTAEVAEDPLLRAAVAYVRTETFFVTRDLETASQLLVHSSDDLAAASLNSPAAAASYGALHMRAAVVAGRAGNADAAQDHLTEAHHAALRVPDGVYAGTSFGPSSVRIHELAVAVELGDRPAMIDRAATWAPPSDLPAERRSHYYIDLARAQHNLGHHDDSYQCLQTARQIAPQHTREHPQVHKILSLLLEIGSAPHDGLLELATWARVHNSSHQG